MREDDVSVMLGTPRASQKSLRMSNDDHWASTLITEARKRHPLVTQAVSARIDQLPPPLLTGSIPMRTRGLPLMLLTPTAVILRNPFSPVILRSEATKNLRCTYLAPRHPVLHPPLSF